jgi:FkbM family methyltransferase
LGPDIGRGRVVRRQPRVGRMDYGLVLAAHAIMAARLGIIKRPLRTCLSLILRGKARFEFDGGLTIVISRRNLRLISSLLELSYPHGVTFSATGSTDDTAWEIDPTSEVITIPNGIRITLDSVIDPVVIAETFVYDIHFMGPSLAGQVIVDVGANVGDTALYFANLGARVIAYEPDPSNFAKLLRNLRLNPELAAKISPHNEAVGPDGFIDFHAGLRGASGRFIKGGEVIQVPSVSLRTLLIRDVEEGQEPILKLDVKGGEVEILEQMELDRFARLVVEYTSESTSSQPISLLIGALEARGFGVTRRFKHTCGFFRLGQHGIIEATPRSSPSADP